MGCSGDERFLAAVVASARVCVLGAGLGRGENEDWRMGDVVEIVEWELHEVGV